MKALLSAIPVAVLGVGPHWVAGFVTGCDIPTCPFIPLPFTHRLLVGGHLHSSNVHSFPNSDVVHYMQSYLDLIDIYFLSV